jgi:hypothetical protein
VTTCGKREWIIKPPLNLYEEELSETPRDGTGTTSGIAAEEVSLLNSAEEKGAKDSSGSPRLDCLFSDAELNAL